MRIMHKEEEAALIFNSQYLLLIEKLCISRVMKHDLKWIFVIVVVKQASLYSNLSVSKRTEKLLFPLFQAPFYLHSLGKQSIECRRICLYLYKQNFYTDLIIILLLLKKKKKIKKLLGIIEELGSNIFTSVMSTPTADALHKWRL